jgi:hypothetical protein
MNYKALFALIKYWLNGRRSELFDHRYLDEKVIKQINQKAPYDQAQKILRVISGKVKGLGVNRTGYMLICPREVYIVCPGLFKTRAISYNIEAIEQSKYKSGIIFDNVELLIPGRGKCQLRFLKTWGADAKLIHDLFYVAEQKSSPQTAVVQPV